MSSNYAMLVNSVCYQMHLPKPESEYKFHPKRRWKFDFAFPDHRLAVEIEGGVWSGGRHTRASGFVKDMEKYNAAAELGWRILRFTPNQMRHSFTYEQIKKALNHEKLQ